MKINTDRLLRSINDLAKIGSTTEGGITRLALSPEEIESKLFILNLMKESGLETHVDPVGNIVGLLRSGPRIVASGSHADTVINGGRLDGSYGVLAAIEALRTIKESKISLSHSLAAISFTNEEGVRFSAMTGSKYFTGALRLEDAYSLKDWSGTTFKDAIQKSKLSMEPSIPVELNLIDSFVELHIEQGPVLEQSKLEIGVVENIVGIVQYEVTFEGSSDHAGTTPMNMRTDALLVASRAILEANRLAKDIGGDSVATVGHLEVVPGAPNVVPGKTILTIDFRAKSVEEVSRAKKMISEMVQSVASEAGVKYSMRQRTEMAPANMTPRIVNTIQNCVDELGLRSIRMQSGAGHDTMMMRNVTDTGMIFVPSKGGKSHVPIEATDPDDLEKGAQVLTNALAKLAQ